MFVQVRRGFTDAVFESARNSDVVKDRNVANIFAEPNTTCKKYK